MTEEIFELHIGGMHCPACPTRIERVVSTLDGVTNVHVNLMTEKALVHAQSNQIHLSEVVQAIENIGFTAEPTHKSKQSTNRGLEEDSSLKRNFILASLLTFPLAWANVIHFEWAQNLYIPSMFLHPFGQLALAIPLQLIIGFPFYERAWKAIKAGYANMDVLIVLSTSAAFFYSHYLTFTSIDAIQKGEPIVLYYETSAFIITFILLGRLLEARTKTRTTKAIKELYYLQAETAIVQVDGKERKTRVDELTYGDIIVVKPGDKLPIDGDIIQGNSTIDESLLTGESLPIEKNIGHAVYAGTVNISGVLKIEVTKQESETVLSHIICIVEDAQLSKPPIQRIADRVIHVFVPVVIIIAAFTFVLSYLMLQPGQFSPALEKVIAVLIIACPCALGLATPTSIMVGSGRAAQLGILFKEGATLEALGKYKTVIFDKTGTLTKGKPTVTDLYVKDFSRPEFLAMVGAVEKTSTHPIAQALIHEAESIKHPTHEANHVQSIPGHGLTGMVNHQEVLIANRSYVRKNSIHLPFDARKIITTLESEGKTVMIVFIESTFAGILAVTDALKPSAKEVIRHLNQMGVHTYMLTGDNAYVASQVAEMVGIKHVQAEVTPQEKSAFIQDFQHHGTGVIMIGDGMNDAPALAVADIGIALGTESDITLESGDVTIMQGDLQKVIQAITISQQTMRNIKQNLTWSFLYNVVMIPCAMFGWLAPWIAAAAMALSSVSVVLNSLRLHWTRL